MKSIAICIAIQNKKKSIAIPSAIPNHEKYWQYGGNTQKSIANNIAILLVLQLTTLVI